MSMIQRTIGMFPCALAPAGFLRPNEGVGAIPAKSMKHSIISRAQGSLEICLFQIVLFLFDQNPGGVYEISWK